MFAFDVSLALHRAGALGAVDQVELATVLSDVVGQLGSVVAILLAKQLGGDAQLLPLGQFVDCVQYLLNGTCGVFCHAFLDSLGFKSNGCQSLLKTLRLVGRDC
ncbi:hypothetical protein D3C85_1172200 [compost metagenome]